MADKRVDLTYNADGEFDTIDRYADLTGTRLVAASAFGYDTIGQLTSLTQGTAATPTAFADYGGLSTPTAKSPASRTAATAGL